jgi:PleD family two-component response regulator
MAIDHRRFLLTLRASKQASAPTKLTHPVTQTSPAKVLIVDDSKCEREGLAEVLEHWGYRIETAADGLEAWTRLLNQGIMARKDR